MSAHLRLVREPELTGHFLVQQAGEKFPVWMTGTPAQVDARMRDAGGQWAIIRCLTDAAPTNP